MRIDALFTTFIYVSLLHSSFGFTLNQCTRGPSTTALQSLVDAQTDVLNSCSYECPIAGELYCGSGTACLPATHWCDGTPDATNDCPNNVDEGTVSGQYCATTAVCVGCNTLIAASPNPGTGRSCKPVFWTPPVSTTNAVIADCNHFPGTTFPSATGSATPTTVVYAIDMNGVVPNRHCAFDVIIPAGACDPPVNNCPNTALRTTADAGETTAKVTWTEITTDASATVAIDNESHRPGSMFPLGYTRVEYTITKTADTSMKSYCVFYVNVKASSSTPSSLNCDWLEPITKIITPPTLSASVQTELDALLSEVPASVTKTMSTLTTDFLFPLGSNEFHVILEDNGEGIVCPTTILITYPADNSNPVISNCPENSVDVCYSNGVTIVSGTWTEPIATDDVAVKSFTSNIKPGTFLTIPSALDPPVTVEYKAVDYTDKTTQCTFNLNFVVC